MTVARGRFTVAIDGPAAAGKGTISKAVAERFGLAHLDTGLLYRAVGVKFLEEGGEDGAPEHAARIASSLTETDLARSDLRSARAGMAAGRVAAMPGVRAALLDFQRRFAERAGGAVLDGRDIGTVICPSAEVKIYVTASDEARARRRWRELLERGEEIAFEQVLADQKARDEGDAARELAPMRRAADAHLLDTTDLSISDAIAKAAEIIEQALTRVGR